VTLKYRLRVTQGHCKQNHWTHHTRLLLVELFDVEYYRDLEMWVRGYSRSLKMVPLKSMSTVSYSPSVVTMAVSVAILEIFSVKEIVRACQESFDFEVPSVLLKKRTEN